MAKILIVDDDEETLTWMAAALESAGHVVRTGSSGRAALQVIEVWKPDLILSDVLMSEMDGFALSKLTRRRGIPTVFVSITKREAEAILHGVAGYVEKPVTAAELRAGDPHRHLHLQELVKARLHHPKGTLPQVLTQLDVGHPPHRRAIGALQGLGTCLTHGFASAHRPEARLRQEPGA